MTVSPLTFVLGGENIPGLVYKMYIADRRDVLLFPQRKTSSAIGDKLTLDGNILLKPGRVWKCVEIISDTGKIIHQAVGFLKHKAYVNKLDFKLQKDKGSDEWFQKHLNFDGIILIREKSGRYRVFGDDDNGAKFESVEGIGGADIYDERSWIAQIVDKTGKIAPYYDGEIKLVNSSWSSAFSSAFS